MRNRIGCMRGHYDFRPRRERGHHSKMGGWDYGDSSIWIGELNPTLPRISFQQPCTNLNIYCQQTYYYFRYLLNHLTLQLNILTTPHVHTIINGNVTRSSSVFIVRLFFRKSTWVRGVRACGKKFCRWSNRDPLIYRLPKNMSKLANRGSELRLRFEGGSNLCGSRST